MLGMAQFSLIRLFGSMTLIAAGFGLFTATRNYTLFTPWLLIGAGFGFPFKQPLLGAAIGSIVFAALFWSHTIH
jgi:hypothetical protein